MRSTPALLAAAFAGALAAGPARAADEAAFMIDTTSDLARLCAVQVGSPLFGSAIHMCHGYLLGVHHFHTALAAEIGEDVYCIERVQPTPTRDQVVAAFVAWVGETPGAGETEALDGLLTWAAATYPCTE